MRRHVSAILCATSLLVVTAAAAGPKPNRESSRRSVAAALDRFERLVDDGRLDEAARVAEELRESHPHNRLARLLRVQAQLLRTLAAARKGDGAPAEPSATALVVMTYPVADLVIPLPGPATIAIGRTEGEGRNASRGMGVELGAVDAKADFDTLIDLLVSTVAPESWGPSGGSGSVRAQETTLSLVVRQTPAVHEEIAELLDELRRLQDVQVVLELRYVGVPVRMFERIGVDFDFEAGTGDGRELRVIEVAYSPALPDLDERGHAVLSHDEAKAFIETVQGEARSNILSAPRVTLFNGQAARVFNEEWDGQRGLLVRTLASADRRKVQLRLGRDGADGLDVLDSVRDFVVADGETLVVEQGTEKRHGVPVGVPVLSKLPYVSRLFKNTATIEPTRRLLLVTPRVIVAEDEEEVHSACGSATCLGGVTPLVIAVEEEPSLLEIEP